MKVREKLMTDKDYTSMSLVEAQTEARRLQNTMTYLHKQTGGWKGGRDQEGQSGEAGQAGWSGRGGGGREQHGGRRPDRAGQQRLGIAQLHQRMHLYVGTEEEQCLEDVCDEAATYFTFLAKSKLLSDDE